MVAFDVDIGKASIHLDPASMTIKNMWFKNGPYVYETMV